MLRPDARVQRRRAERRPAALAAGAVGRPGRLSAVQERHRGGRRRRAGRRLLHASTRTSPISDVDVDEAIALAATFGFARAGRSARAIASPSTARRCASATWSSTSCSSNPAVGAGFRLASRASVGALIAVPGYSDGVDSRRARCSVSQLRAFAPDGDVDYPGSRRVRARRCRERAALSAACRHRWRIVGGAVLTQNRSAHAAAVGARCRESRACADSPAAGLAGARDDLGRRHARRDSRHRAHARCAACSAPTCRCRRRAPRRSCRRPRPAAFLAALPDAKYLSDDARRRQRRACDPHRQLRQRRCAHSSATATRSPTDRSRITDRAIGNLARPFFPDGIDDEGPGRSASRRASGARSRPACSSTSSINAILQHVLFVAGAGVQMSRQAARACSSQTISAASARRSPVCGSATACRSSRAACRSIAAARSSARIGVSGDGVDQDDMIAFLGLHNAGQSLGGAIGNAPADRRADTLIAAGRAAALRAVSAGAVHRLHRRQRRARASDMKRRHARCAFMVACVVAAAGDDGCRRAKPVIRTTRAASSSVVGPATRKCRVPTAERAAPAKRRPRAAERAHRRRTPAVRRDVA